MTDTTVLSGRRWRRRGVVAVFSILLVAGGCTGLDVWAGSGVEAEVARFESRFVSLNQSTPLVPHVPAADNRTRIVRAAAALTVPGPTGFYSSVYRLLNQRDSSEVPADLRAFVEANRAAIRLADDVRTRRLSHWEVEYRDGNDRPPLLDIRTLSEVLFVAALVDLDAGRLDDASRVITSGLAVSSSFRQEPDLLSQLVRIAVATRHFAAVQRLVTHFEPSTASLEDLAGWLAENRSPDPIQVGLVGEVRQVHAVLTRMERGQVDTDTGSYVYPQTWPSLPRSWFGPLARIGRPIVRMAHARYLRQMGDRLAQQTGPRPRPPVAEPETPRRWQLADRLVEKFIAGVDRSVETGDLFISELAATEVAVALRRFRLQHGAYPEDLGALVPTYFERLPIDASTGRPPIYQREGTGFTLRLQTGPNSRPAAWASAWPALRWNVAR